MRPFCFAVFLALLLQYSTTYAQRTLTARVVEVGNGKPISQVNVHLKNSSVGAITDEKGRFLFTIKDTDVESTVTISHIGYQTKTIPISQLESTIELEEQVYQIGEVSVKYVSLRKLLIKKWKMDDSSLDTYVKLSLSMLKNKNSNHYEKVLKDPASLSKVANSLRLHFYDDGTAKVSFSIFLRRILSWKYDDQQRTISLIDQQGIEKKRVITELTENHLILRRISDDGVSWEIGYVPVN